MKGYFYKNRVKCLTKRRWIIIINGMKIIFQLFLVLIAVINISSCSSENNSYSPILILATNSNFGSYTPEILKAEGFNEFKLDSLTNPNVTLSFLKKFDIVLLSETSISKFHKEMLSDYVKAGEI